jgi:hypothetical protein
MTLLFILKNEKKVKVTKPTQKTRGALDVTDAP